ncbi:MAG TPA: hypothetical protein GX509_07830 [Firmicutes bacterium]|nr:hypothetical protein [Bacillota bacterium]HHY98632.1 hypothetical protein [Bacillota bacterium]
MSQEIKVLEISARKKLSGGSSADEGYARIQARYDCLEPNIEWFARAERLEREIREARMDERFNEN